MDRISYRTTFQGAHVFSTMLFGQLFEKQYMFYGKSEAKKLFIQELENKKADLLGHDKDYRKEEEYE